MNLLQKLAHWTARKAYGAGVSFTLADSDLNQKLAGWWGVGGTYTGKTVTDTSCMQVTAFFACVRLLAETMGAMPSAIFVKEKNGNAARAEDHPLHEVLVEQPNSDMNGVEYREASTSNLAARGNTYSIIERRSSGDVISLYPVPSARVQIKRDESTNFEIRYGIADRGKQEWYPSEKIWHRRGFSFDGLTGLSPLQCAREAIGLSLAGEEFNARLFGQGLVPSALVSIPQWLTPEQRVEANKKLLEMHTGAQNLHRPMLLEGGMKVEAGLMTPDEAQFLQLRQFTVIEICRMLGVKPHMIAALERATDNNIEKLSLEFLMFTMRPHLYRDEQAARKLFKPADKSKFFYRYNFEGLLRADSAARASLYSIFLQNGIFTRNEVRALENRNTSDASGMDDFSVQLNMTLVQFLEQIAQREANPKTVPPVAPQKAGDLYLNVAQPSFTLHNKSGDVHLDIPEREVHFEATLPEMKASDVHVDVNMPAMKPPDVNVKQVSLDFSGLEKTIADGNARMEKGIKDLGKPRKAVFDKDGNPIGTVPVDSLE